MIRTFDPQNCALIITKVDNFTGKPQSYLISNWESAFFSFTDPRYEFSTATTGQITRSRIMNKLGTCTIVASEGSDCGSLLSKLVNSRDKIAVDFTETVSKDSGNTTVAQFSIQEGAVSDGGDAGRARVAGERTWVITGEIKKFEDGDYVD